MVEFDREGRMWDAHDIRVQGALSIMLPPFLMVGGGILWSILSWTPNGLGLAAIGAGLSWAAIWNYRRVKRDKRSHTKGFWYEPPQSGG